MPSTLDRQLTSSEGFSVTEYLQREGRSLVPHNVDQNQVAKITYAFLKRAEGTSNDKITARAWNTQTFDISVQSLQEVLGIIEQYFPLPALDRQVFNKVSEYLMLYQDASDKEKESILSAAINYLSPFGAQLDHLYQFMLTLPEILKKIFAERSVDTDLISHEVVPVVNKYLMFHTLITQQIGQNPRQKYPA